MTSSTRPYADAAMRRLADRIMQLRRAKSPDPPAARPLENYLSAYVSELGRWQSPRRTLVRLIIPVQC
jgi:hypothetical protein